LNATPVTFVGCRHPAGFGFYRDLEATATTIQEQAPKTGIA
jgi:hypothetical protein